MLPLVSIIVPLFNAAPYLKKCISSVLSQTYKHFELILVDDGSSDSSPHICKEFTHTDSRIRYIRKTNGGVSSARNTGIDITQGEWIIFLDADDYWIEQTALEQLVNMAINRNLDIVRGEYISVNEKEEPIFLKDYSSKVPYANKTLTPSVFLKHVIMGEFFLVLCLIRKKSIGDIRFDTSQVFLEDMKLFVTLLANPLRCAYIPCTFYAYKKISSSASHSNNIKKLSDAFSMASFFRKTACNSTDIDFKNYCNYYAIMMYCWTLQTVSEDSYYPKRTEIVSLLQLNQLHKNLNRLRNNEHIIINIKYRIIINLKPLTGIYIFKLKEKINKWIKI